jgi:hypothetical protein
VTSSADLLEPLEGKSSTLFLLAGGVLAVFATNTAARVFADSGLSAVHCIVGPAGFFLGIVGLFGLYPALVSQTPTLVRVTGVVAAIPAMGWFVITVFGIGSSAGVLPGMSVVFPPVFPMLVVLTTILAYLLLGVTSLRAESHSRAVSIALLLPAVPFLTLIVGMAVLGPVEVAEFIIDSGHVLAYLLVGFTLRSESGSTAPGEPVAEATP